MQVTVSASNMWVTLFIAFMQVRVSVAIIQVVFYTVHKCFYCKKQVTVSVITMQVTHSSNNFVFNFLSGNHFS